jgi:DNA topoisomerase-1
MAKEGKNLVIIESPYKAKTIGKILGKDYIVAASGGHLRDLPKNKMSVDLENGFIPDYQPIKGKEQTINELRESANKSEKVYLATDPDREGEAISWHLKELLELSDEKAFRVTFNELTKKVVIEGIQSPRPIDMNLVDAQQARRILDRIVGYKLSPLLWSKIKRGLSAGRVQSVVTRMVVDREEEIKAFVPEEYWLLDVVLECIGKPGSFTARFHGAAKKQELKSKEELDKVVEAIKTAPFTIKSVKRRDRQRAPSAPFITSTLQQEASRRLNMTPKRTMMIAQQLYEGIDISGQGTIGIITYMRTDSLRVSQEAQEAAKSFILNRYGSEYYPKSPRVFKTKKGAQDAHEAIRPTEITLEPESIRKDLTNDQYRLYKLIWNRFMASQMANAVYDTVTIEAQSAGYVFKANHSSLKFPGFTALYDDNGKDEEDKNDKKPLPELQEGEEVNLSDIVSEQKFTQPPPRYTEDSLIRAMEEKGIGRPSTYAPTMSTIMDREYVVKEGKHLKPTALGQVVTQLMKDRFEDIVDVEFTARLEERLDSIEEGEREWKSVLAEFYDDFAQALKEAEAALEGVRIKIPDEVTEEICDECGRNMVIKSGRFGRFLACPGYPECNFTKPLVIEMPGKCPKCGNRILKRSSKKGYTYYACEKGAQCGFMTWDVPVKDSCPECGQTMFKKSGRGYRKPFCINEACSNFVPEEKRGYKKKAKTDATEPEKQENNTEKEKGTQGKYKKAQKGTDK